MDAVGQLQTLHDLEVRHEDLLKRIDELDHRVKKVLAECLGGQQVAGSSSSST